MIELSAREVAATPLFGYRTITQDALLDAIGRTSDQTSLRYRIPAPWIVEGSSQPSIDIGLLDLYSVVVELVANSSPRIDRGSTPSDLLEAQHPHLQSQRSPKGGDPCMLATASRFSVLVWPSGASVVGDSESESLWAFAATGFSLAGAVASSDGSKATFKTMVERIPALTTALYLPYLHGLTTALSSRERRSLALDNDPSIG